MELEEFIKTVLIEISSGIRSAKEDTKLPFYLGATPAAQYDTSKARIEFDVAVEASEKKVGGKEAGVHIKVVKASLEGGSEKAFTSSSRIHFVVEKNKVGYNNSTSDI